MKPIIIVNFKTYEQGTGENAEKLAEIIKKISEESGVKIIPAVQTGDAFRVSRIVPAFCQHVDCVNYGAKTGHILPECAKKNGSVGTLINHSEHKIGIDNIGLTINRCKEAGLETLVCVENIEDANNILKFNPDYIALEDPTLIGSGVSITQTQPENLKKFVALFKNSSVIPLCGAGISNSDDVKKALEFGMKGVLLASAIVKSADPEKSLRELVSEFLF